MKQNQQRYDPGRRLNRLIGIFLLIALLFAVAGLLKMWLGG
jgi:hypothetical protein